MNAFIVRCVRLAALQLVLASAVTAIVSPAAAGGTAGKLPALCPSAETTTAATHALLTSLERAGSSSLHQALAQHAAARRAIPEAPRLEDEISSVLDQSCRTLVERNVSAALVATAGALATLAPAERRDAAGAYRDAFTALAARLELSQAAYRYGVAGFAALPATVPAACHEHDGPVSVVGTPVVPAYSQLASQQGATGTAIVAVTVDALGAVTKTAIFASSNFPALDLAASEAARRTRYHAAVAHCRAVSGTYLFQANFPD